jgi:pimeloyl-ACP methyl ester carboxylesterase
MNRIRADLLEIAFEEGGPRNGAPILLLHGWPDSARGWTDVSERLHAANWRTIVPYLRGAGPTEFLSNRCERVNLCIVLHTTRRE